VVSLELEWALPGAAVLWVPGLRVLLGVVVADLRQIGRMGLIGRIEKDFDWNRVLFGGRTYLFGRVGGR
jgi:hypothetical protein